jgi:hypothetical protein
MFNRRTVIMTAILAVLVALILSRPAPKPEAAPVTVEKPARVAAAAQEVQKKSIAQKPAPEEEPVLDENQREQECWNKLEREYPETSGFMSYARRDLDGVVGQWYFDSSVPPKITENSPKSERFLYALARAGFLFGGPEFERNEQEAYSILFDLAFEDRDNAAPLLYLAALEKRKPETDQAFYESFLKSALERSSFNTYKKDIYRAVMKHVHTPNDFLAAQASLAAGPEPEVTIFKKVITDAKYAPLAIKMMTDGLQAKKKVMEGVDYIGWEYTIGRHILKQLGLADNFPTVDEVRAAEPFRMRCHPRILDDYIAEIKTATGSGN